MVSTPAKKCDAETVAPCARASSQSGDWSADEAFDGQNLGTLGRGWCSMGDEGGHGWLQYEFPEPVGVTKVKIWFWRNDHSATGEAYMEASNDGSTWTRLHTITQTEYDYLEVEVPAPIQPLLAG